MTFLGEERWGAIGLGSSACKIPSHFPSKSAFERHLPRQTPDTSDWRRRPGSAGLAPALEPRFPRQVPNPLPALAPDRPYSLSGYGGGPNRCSVKVPGSIPGKILKPGSDLGRKMKSMVRYEEVASDPTAVWRIATTANHKTDMVQHQRGDFQKVMAGMRDQLNRMEILAQRLVNSQARVVEARNMKDLRQSTLESIQEIHPMGAPEGNLNSPLTGFSVVATDWEQDQLPKVSVRRIEWENPKDTDEGDFGIPSWLFEDTDEGDFGIPSWLFGFSLPDAVERAKDLAVLEMDSSTDLLKPINVGQSSALRVGQQCLAMGNPFGFDHILTADVISGLNRDIFSKAGAHFHMKQGAFLHNLEAQTLPKSLHCNFIRADKRLRLTGRFWKLPPWPDLCTMNCDRFDQHCESTLTDSLVAAAGIIVQEVVGDVSKTDTRIDKAKRGITIKSTGNSLFYEMTEISLMSYKSKMDGFDEKLLRLFASGSRAVLNPMAAMLGGNGAPARPRAPAPKWLKCPTGASFSFGGKLVSFHPAVPTQGALVATSEVHVHSLVIEQSLVNRSTEFEAAIQNGNTIWQRICKHKQPIIEYRQSSNFPNAMEDYAAKLHDSSTSGAIFFAVCRGKVSEGLDFADQAESADDLSLDIPSAVTLFDRMFSIAISEEWLDASLSKSAIPDGTIVGREDKKSSQVVRIWDPGSESKNMKWGRIETSGHMLSFNVVTDDNVEVVSPQAEAERQLMQISVKSPSVGKNIKLNVKKSNSAADVKAEIERKVGILMNKQILLYKGHQLEMMIFHLPFPSKAQEYHVENLYEEPLDDTYSTAVRNCDQEGSLMLYASKVIPASDKGRFFAFGRAFSGKVATGLKVHILDPNYVTGQNQKTGLYVKSVQRTKTWRKLEECAAFIELNSTKVYARPIKLQVFTIAEAYDFKDLESMFQEVATVFKTKVMFIYVDIAEDNPTKPFLAFYGLKPEKLIVTAFDISKGAKYLMESDTNVKNLREFCLGLLDVTLPPYFRSELVQQEMGLVEKVVRSTFNYSVLESHENVLLEVHAPWCVDCEAISKNREMMAKHFSGLHNLKSARIDAAVSEHLKLQKLNLKNMMRFTKEKLQIAGLETVPTADNSKFSVELESFTLKSVGRIF